MQKYYILFWTYIFLYIILISMVDLPILDKYFLLYNMRFLLRFLFTAIAIYLLMYYNYLPGISLTDGTNSLLIFTFILGLVNLVIGGILRLITLPLRILSLGLIGFIISIVVVILTDEFVTGIHITGWTTIILVALTMSIVSMILS